ncbi:MAG: Histone transcription regulator 3 [Vezdaea aestivalis]|nr:MAG: Histone transcription regulator 3 [Vezdaea aestivalis]
MASFKALNALPDEDSEDETDDTKELQIEEALKLYQNALKLHAQGAPYFVQAGEAYNELFRSEIWSWPESQPDWEQAHTTVDDAEEESTAEGEVPGFRGTGDTAPSTLPQILYSSLKNHGQYMIEAARKEAKTNAKDENAQQQGLRSHKRHTGPALDRFVGALGQDETDVELWRRAGRVAGSLGSKRIERFCLESVLDQEQEGPDNRLQSHGLEESFAIDGLVKLVRSISDETSLLQSPLKELQRRKLASFLRNARDPYPFLPSSEQSALSTSEELPLMGTQPPSVEVQVPARSWSAVGLALLQVLFDCKSPGAGIRLTLPPSLDQTDFAGEVDEAPANVVDDVENHVQSDRHVPTSPKSGTHSRRASESIPAPAPNSSEPHNGSAIPNDDDDESDSKAARASKSRSMSPRKRTSSSAGLPEEGGRVRSKRLKARGSKDDPLANGDKSAVDTQRFDERQQMLNLADNLLFDHVNVALAKIGASPLGPISALRAAASSNEETRDSSDAITDTAIQDLREFYHHYSEGPCRMLLYGTGLSEEDNYRSLSSLGKTPTAGVLAFLDYANGRRNTLDSQPIWSEDEGLTGFEQTINLTWCHLRHAAIHWVLSLLTSSKGVDQDAPDRGSRYECNLWSNELKMTMMRMLVAIDDDLFMSLDCAAESDTTDSEEGHSFLVSRTQLVQNIFEIHLDILGTATSPGSELKSGDHLLQKDRCERWAGLTSDYIRKASRHQLLDHATLVRYFWAMTCFTNLVAEESQEHIVLCIRDLKATIGQINNPAILLPNNSLMGELSTAAADREIAKITMKDMFLGLFRNSSDDEPTEGIETLELVLMPSDLAAEPDAPELSPQDSASIVPTELSHEARLKQMAKFIQLGKPGFKLLLWFRLRKAYEGINYSPKVISCILRMIEVIMDDLKSSAFAKASPKFRLDTLMKWLRELNVLTQEGLTLMLGGDQFLECIDLEHSKSSIAALIELVTILHSFTLMEDPVRLGQRSITESMPARAAQTFLMLGQVLRDMSIRCWTMLFILLKDAMGQQKDVIPDPTLDLINFVRGLHYSYGLRAFCHGARRVFLQYAEFQLLQFEQSEERDAELAQIFRDLYGIGLTSPNFALTDHGCKAETLKMNTALKMMPFVLQLVRKGSMKDGVRPEFRAVLDRMQQVIGAPKATNAMTHNLRIYSAYLKTQINPMKIFGCLKGQGDISWIRISGPATYVANQDWYFISGYAALSKFRSQKRTSATPTDDISIANTFFRIDLQYGMDKWETWYRQAQAYDTLVEEDVSWSAEKLNGTRRDIKENQRLAIHCYTRAVACAIRNAKKDREDNDETRETDMKVSKMFTDFGFRIYASATPPLSMEVFDLQSHVRPHSGSHGLYNKPIYHQMTKFQAFAFAAALFRRALVDMPDYWKNHYMLGKCLWKMSTLEGNVRNNRFAVDVQTPLKSFVDALKDAPRRREKQEPVLEPHYKLLSTVYKHVKYKRLDPEIGVEFLQNSHYFDKTSFTPGLETWNSYILKLLKALRAADKANWHHRTIVRTALIMEDSAADPIEGARAARNELSDKIFTKTMAVQVWRPEHERTGRHFVYTTEYVRIFTRLLGDIGLEAKPALELLAKKVRRANAHFYQHEQVWIHVCSTYAKVLRAHVEHVAPQGTESTAFHALSQQDFAMYAFIVEEWCRQSANTHPLLDLLREAQELKRLNGVTSAGIKPYKGPLIDDLIADVYAKLHLHLRFRSSIDTTDLPQRAIMGINNLHASTPPAPSTQLQEAQSAGQQPTSTSTTTPAPSAPQPAPRNKHASRKDVLRAAEQAANRSSASAPPVLPSSTSAAPQTLSAKPQEPITELPITTEPAEAESEGDEFFDTGWPWDFSPIEGVPLGSSDSADESELSEVDEELVEGGELEGLGRDKETDEEEDVDMVDLNAGDEGEEKGDVEDEDEGDEVMQVDEAKVEVPLMFPNLARRRTDGEEEKAEKRGEEAEGNIEGEDA